MPNDEASALVNLAKNDVDYEFVNKAKRHQRYEYHHQQEDTDTWLKLSDMDLGDGAIRSLKKYAKGV